MVDFHGRAGFAEKILAALPCETQPISRSMSRTKSGVVTIDEALARARAADKQVCEEDELRAKERVEKQRQALMQQPPPHRQRGAQGPGSRGGGGEPGRAGAELLLASLLEAAREGNRGTVPAAIRIQCPFCGAVNSARAAAGHRVICGGCRSVFAVPASAGEVAGRQR